MYLLAFCAETAEIWTVIGNVLNVFKIVIPLLLIIFGMIDLGKAVISSDEKQISKSTQTIIKRLIAAVVIFFIPTIVSVVFGLIASFGEQRGDFNICKECISHPGNCKSVADLACTEKNGVYYGPDGKELTSDKQLVLDKSTKTREEKKEKAASYKTAKEKFEELCK